MAKISLDTVVSGFKSVAALIANFTTIKDHLDNKVLYRDNPIGEPNQMFNDLDMNSQDVLNATIVEADTIIVGGVTFIPGLGGELNGEGASNVAFQQEESTLSEGQTAVTFSNPTSTANMYINGPDVDSRRLLIDVDFTVDHGLKTVFLVETYPAGTVLTLVYPEVVVEQGTEGQRVHEFIDVSASQTVITTTQPYTPGTYSLEAFLNGELISPTKYTENSPTQFTLDTPIADDADELDVFITPLSLRTTYYAEASNVGYVPLVGSKTNVQLVLQEVEGDIDDLETFQGVAEGQITTLQAESVDYEARIAAIEATLAGAPTLDLSRQAVAMGSWSASATPTFKSSAGVSTTINRLSVGQYRVSFSVARADANYIVLATAGSATASSPLECLVTNQGTAFFEVETWFTTGGTTRDYQDRDVNFVVFDLNQ